MKNEAKRLWKELEAEAEKQEKEVEGMILEVPQGARSSEELLEELMLSFGIVRNLGDGTEMTTRIKKFNKNL